MTKPLSAEEKRLRVLERLTSENSDLRSLNKKLLRRGGFDFEQVIDELRGVLKREKSQPFVVAATPTKSLTKTAHEHSEVAALVWSDWHVTEVISDKETNNANKFNSLIAANRIAEIVKSTKQIIGFHRTAYNFDKIWISILGDMISGSHVSDLELTNDMHDSSAAILTARLLHMAILDLSELGIPIEIDCLAGNHGRFSAKLFSKRMAYDTWDYVIFEMLAYYFEDNPNVTIRIHPGYVVPVKQFGHKYILMHGTDAKMNRLESLEDAVMAMFDSKIYREFSKESGSSFDIILCGHFHHSIIREKLIVNSCLGGQSELGLAWKLHPLVEASQTMFGISARHPKTWLYNLEVGSIRSEKPENQYSKYTKEYLKKHGR